MNKQSPKNIKIVLAEDEQMIAMAFEMGLGYEGYQVLVAVNGEEAWELVQKEHPDLVLLDLIMPKMNGFEVLKKIRSDDSFKHLPVIVLSNLSQVADESKARELGATEFLVKSDYSLKELAKEIEIVLSNAK